MRRFITILGVFALSLPTSAMPEIDSVQAKQLARVFLSRMGANAPPEPVQSLYPAPKRYSGLPDLHWQKRHRFFYKAAGLDVAEIEVASDTGTVTWFYNYGLSSLLRARNAPPAPAISQSEALSRGIAAIQAAGQITELAGPSALLTQVQGGTDFGRLWIIRWQRVTGSYPYRNQQCTAILVASSGELMAFSVTFPTSSVQSTLTKLSRAQAIDSASAILRARGESSFSLTRAEKEIVQPNTYWELGGSARPTVATAHLAWTCVFQAGTKIYEVWIDTADGKVLGGEIQSIHTHSRP